MRTVEIKGKEPIKPIKEKDQIALMAGEGVKFDNDKSPIGLVPPESILAMASILGYGAKKYAPRNWEKGMAWGRIFDSLQRHLWAWWSGEDNDPESGLPHLAHAITNVAFLLTYSRRGTGTDDRPSKYKEPV